MAALRVTWEGKLARPHVEKVPGAFSDQRWRAWVPPTDVEHFDVDPSDPALTVEFLLNDAAVLGPWGDTYWDTWREAYDFVCAVLTDLRNEAL